MTKSQVMQNSVVEFQDKTSYIGEHLSHDNKIIREGFGEFTYLDGSKYSGGWIGDRQHGEGL